MNCVMCDDRGEIGGPKQDGYETDRCPDCNPRQWLVIKSSRGFSKFSYTGPALQRTSFKGRANTTFNDYDEAVRCARELTRENPVGFDVWFDEGRLVWSYKDDK